MPPAYTMLSDQDVDAIVCPTAPVSAFAAGERIDDPLKLYAVDVLTVGANLAGIPAISLPAGLNSQGLPIAIQLQAPVLEEARLLFVGAAYQAATDHHRQRPNV